MKLLFAMDRLQFATIFMIVFFVGSAWTAGSQGSGESAGTVSSLSSGSDSDTSLERIRTSSRSGRNKAVPVPDPDVPEVTDMPPAPEEERAVEPPAPEEERAVEPPAPEVEPALETGESSSTPPAPEQMVFPQPENVPDDQVTAKASGDIKCRDQAEPHAIVELRGIPTKPHWKGDKHSVKTKLGIKGECIGFGITDQNGHFEIKAKKPLGDKNSFEIYVFSQCRAKLTWKLKKKAYRSADEWTKKVYRIQHALTPGSSPPTLTANVDLRESKVSIGVNKVTDAYENLNQRCY